MTDHPYRNIDKLIKDTFGDCISIDMSRFGYSLVWAEIKRQLESLTPRQEKVIIERYGLGYGKEPRTYKSIGKDFGVSRPRIWEIQMKALRRLRHPSRAIKIKPFLLEGPL